MSKKLNKQSIPLVFIAILFIIATILAGFKLGLTVLVFSFLIYTFATQKYMFKVFKAVKAYKIEDYKTALELYRDASISPYCNASIINDYLICELKYGKPSIALEYSQDLFTKRKFKQHELLKLKITYSTVLWKNNEITEAINTLRSLVNKDKTVYLYEAYTSLLISTGNITEAKNIIDEALEYDKSNNILLSNYGEINFKLGNYDIAEETFNKVLESNVKFVEPYYYLGLIECTNGNFEKSKELLETAQGLNESLVTAVKPADIEQAYNKVVFKSLSI